MAVDVSAPARPESRWYRRSQYTDLPDGPDHHPAPPATGCRGELLNHVDFARSAEKIGKVPSTGRDAYPVYPGRTDCSHGRIIRQPGPDTAGHVERHCDGMVRLAAV